jgi:hypothetical protein
MAWYNRGFVLDTLKDSSVDIFASYRSPIKTPSENINQVSSTVTGATSSVSYSQRQDKLFLRNY